MIYHLLKHMDGTLMQHLIDLICLILQNVNRNWLIVFAWKDVLGSISASKCFFLVQNSASVEERVETERMINPIKNMANFRSFFFFCNCMDGTYWNALRLKFLFLRFFACLFIIPGKIFVDEKFQSMWMNIFLLIFIILFKKIFIRISMWVERMITGACTISRKHYPVTYFTILSKRCIYLILFYNLLLIDTHNNTKKGLSNCIENFQYSRGNHVIFPGKSFLLLENSTSLIKINFSFDWAPYWCIKNFFFNILEFSWKNRKLGHNSRKNHYLFFFDSNYLYASNKRFSTICEIRSLFTCTIMWKITKEMKHLYGYKSYNIAQHHS